MADQMTIEEAVQACVDLSGYAPDATHEAYRAILARVVEASLTAAQQRIRELEQERDTLDSQLVQTSALLEAVLEAAEGKPVSDFMESFSGVRLVVDTRSLYTCHSESGRGLRSRAPPAAPATSEH